MAVRVTMRAPAACSVRSNDDRAGDRSSADTATGDVRAVTLLADPERW